MSISTHVLDTSIGRPASAVAVRLQRQEAGDWVEISRSVTNDDGRVAALWPAKMASAAGHYRLTFDIAAYFQRRAAECFYPEVTIDFVIADDVHYHVPLLVSPYGYSTYRGS
jgi:5-hydroxyisourate hydrolase